MSKVLKTNYAKTMEYMVEHGMSIEELNDANHLALKDGRITLEEFQEAAWVLVKERLKY